MKTSKLDHGPYLGSVKLKEVELYKSIYASVKTAILIVTDHHGKIVKWNKGAESAFGYTEGETLGKLYPFLLDKSFRKSSFSDLTHLSQLYAEDSGQEPNVLRCLDKYGKQFTVDFIIRKLDCGTVDLYILKMLDITKRISFQTRLEQKTKELELFLYRSAHDLNAPFSSAQGLINLMKDEHSIEKIQTLVGMLEKTINYAKVMSDGLAKASLVSEQTKESKPIDFAGLVEDVFKTLTGYHPIDNIKFNIDIKDTRDYVSDPDLIFAIFQNLMQNAIKYSRPKTNDHSPFVEIKVLDLGDVMEVMICDNGKGIKKKNLDRIFDMYYKAEAEEYAGSNGLGLYVVKRIVESLNGTIEVESRVKIGACFHIILPKKIKAKRLWE